MTWNKALHLHGRAKVLVISAILCSQNGVHAIHFKIADISLENTFIVKTPRFMTEYIHARVREIRVVALFARLEQRKRRFEHCKQGEI